MAEDDFVTQILRDVADKIFSRFQENIVRDGISDTGGLLLSGGIHEEGKNVVIEYSAPYAEDVESGTTPHLVTVEELLPWVKRKIGIKDDAKALAFAKRVVKKIAAKGTEPRWFMKKAIEQSRRDLAS